MGHHFGIDPDTVSCDLHVSANLQAQSREQYLSHVLFTIHGLLDNQTQIRIGVI